MLEHAVVRAYSYHSVDISGIQEGGQMLCPSPPKDVAQKNTLTLGGASGTAHPVTLQAEGSAMRIRLEQLRPIGTTFGERSIGLGLYTIVLKGFLLYLSCAW